MNSLVRMTMPAVAALAGSLAVAAPPEPQPAPEKILIAPAASSGSFLGIGVSEIDADRAKALNLKEERGVEVTRVEEDSPAAKAGLKTGDVVLEYGGQRVEGTEQFVRLVHETPVGREMKLSISRNGTLQSVAVKTGARRTDSQAKTWFRGGEVFPLELGDSPWIPEIPKGLMSWRIAGLGIEGETVRSQLAQYFGVKEGVLVRSVLKGSVAEKAGLKAGDVITKIDSTQVSSSREISAALRGAKRSCNLALTRERKEMNVNVSLEDEKQSGELNPPRPR
ncbi:MAG: PDZ domain-containing protein [Bryobacteraceae bacterium]